MSEISRFAQGDRVRKKRGYRFPGTVVAVVTKLDGQTRYVVECTAPECKGMLHIFSATDLEMAP